jgi:asparagine synthase (glutamine-hydrolysing)
MCGILGIFSRSRVTEEIKNLSSTISHRGPDNDGLHERKFGNFFSGIAHSRLSILDTSERGNQPMFFKNLLIVFNGEIYNFKNTRRILEKEGYKFFSNSDTEVVLKAFDFWGKNCTKYLDGIYAFSIIDYSKKYLYIFRDQFGVKPLYFFFDNHNFIFSSEAKSIIRSSLFKKKLNKNAIIDYFNLGYLKRDQRIFKKLNLLESGNCNIYSFTDKVELVGTHSIQKRELYNINHNLSGNQVVDELQNKLIKSCEKRLVSDVPVGCFLSGGIDSSLIAGIIKNDLKKNIPTFTLAERGSNSLDYNISKKISKKLGLEHYFYDFDNKRNYFYETFENLSSFIDEPFADISTISMLVLSQEVKKKVKVVISGDGADELFGGYPKYLNIMKRDKMIRNIKYFKNIIHKILNFLYQNYPTFNNLELKKILIHLSSSDEKKIIDIYNSICLPKIYFENNIFKKEFIDTGDKNKFNFLDYRKLLIEDQKGYLEDNILFKLDRTTMSYGLEGREPFLDQDLREFSNRYSGLDLFKGKKLLKELHARYFDKGTYDYNLQKQGFVVRYNSIINQHTKKFTDTLFNKKFIINQGLFNYENLEKLYKKNKKSDRDLKLIYLISCFQIWYNKWM